MGKAYLQRYRVETCLIIPKGKDGKNEFIYINSGGNKFGGVNDALPKTYLPYRKYIKNTKGMNKGVIRMKGDR